MKFIVYTPKRRTLTTLDCVITTPRREDVTLYRYRGEELGNPTLWKRHVFKSCAVSVSDFEAKVDLEFENCDHLKVRKS